jgi:hypothetical protein
MCSRLWLLLWLVGILFPMAWLVRFSPACRRMFDRVFGPAWVHALMHAILFGGLVVLLTFVFRLPVDHRTALVAISAVLALGALQEGFQVLSQGFLSLEGAAVDLGVDLSGGILGLAISVLMGSLPRN